MLFWTLITYTKQEKMTAKGYFLMNYPIKNKIKTSPSSGALLSTKAQAQNLLIGPL